MTFMRRQTTILLLFLIGFTLQAEAQIWPHIKTDANEFLKSGKEFYGTLFTAEKRCYVNAALIGAGVIGISLLDKKIRSFAQENQSAFGNSLFSIDNYYGDKWYTAGGIAVLYSAGLLSGSKGLRETGLLAAEAWFYTGLTAVFIKELFGRSRPYRNTGPYDFHPFRFKEPSRSFFSGHASTVFAVSTVMASRIDNIFWQTAWFSAALLTSTARIYHDQHWLSDVTAGALIGYAIGRFMVDRDRDKKTSKLTISPQLSASRPPMVQIAFKIK